MHAQGKLQSFIVGHGLAHLAEWQTGLGVCKQWPKLNGFLRIEEVRQWIRCVAIVPLGVAVTACESEPVTPMGREAKYCSSLEGKRSAAIHSKYVITRMLKSPSTAEFAFIPDEAISYSGNCEFTVVSHVDAQNSFGATLRSNYRIEFRYDPNYEAWDGRAWKVIDIKM